MANQQPVPFLLYHTISEAPSPKLSGFAVHPRQFREQMTLVRDSGRRPITAGALVDSLGTPQPDTNVVVVTFDDGYRDFLEVALPIMADLGIDSSLYVTSGWLADADPATRDRGPSDPMLAATDLPQLRKLGQWRSVPTAAPTRRWTPSTRTRPARSWPGARMRCRTRCPRR